jgi:hypothetical protein
LPAVAIREAQAKPRAEKTPVVRVEIGLVVFLDETLLDPESLGGGFALDPPFDRTKIQGIVGSIDSPARAGRRVH